MRRIVTIIAALLAMSLTASAQLAKHQIIAKGDWSAGFSCAYMTFSSDNSQLLMLLRGIDAHGTITTASPSVTFAYAPNHAIGIKYSISRLTGSIASGALNLLGDGLEFGVEDFDADVLMQTGALFHRSYIGLDGRGRFGLFYDFTLSYGSSSTQFSAMSSAAMGKASLSFSPGFIAFATNHLSTHVSVSIADVTYRETKFYDNDALAGTKSSWRAQASLDVLGLSFGMAYHF